MPSPVARQAILLSGTAVKPVWQANFLTASSLPAGLTYTKSGSIPATLFDSTGKLTYGGNNLILQSQTLSTSPWSTGGVSTLTPGITAPDGTSTAFQITYLADGSRITQQIASIPAPSLIYSVYLKVASVDNGATILVYDNTAGSTLTSLTVNTIAGSGIDAGNGWRRVYLALSPIVGHNLTFYVYTDKSNGAIVGGSLYAWGAQVEAVTYQTTPSAYNATTSAAYYAPRFDYDPSTLAPRGLLVEEQRTNIQQYSQVLTTSNWAAVNATGATGSYAAPDGSNNAVLFTENSATAIHQYWYSGAQTTTAAAYTVSVYAKLNSGSRYFTVYPQTTTVGWAIFDLSNGTVKASGGGAYLSNSITPVGNGWYRCSVTWTASAVVAYPTVFYLTNSSSTPAPSYAGDGTSSVFLWGAQVELGSFPTSYIPNPTASTVTRTADVVQFNGVPLAALKGPAFTVGLEAQMENSSPTGSPVMMGDAVTSPNIAFAFLTSSTVVSSYYSSALNATLGSGTVTSPFRLMSAGSAAGRSLVANGGTVQTNATPFATPSTVNLGSYSFVSGDHTTQPSSGWYRSVALYSQRLPDAKLKSLSVVGAPY